jgi:nucleoside-diphosphate-sugar epimerase
VTSRRIVVTGGSGFIGTNLVQTLMDRGDTVLNLDLVAPGVGSHRAAWKQVDLLDAPTITQAIAGFRPDAVYNLAAVADIALAAEAMLPNTQGLRNVVAGVRAAPGAPILIHASTQLVIGPEYVPQHPRDYHPYTPYGQSKADSEEILWEEAGDVRWTIVRPATVWGPWHASFHKSIWRYLNRGWYMLPTGIDPIRSYGYVGTIVAQMLAILDAEPAKVDRQAFYLGDEPIRSSVWLDGFSRAMTGRRARRVPGIALRLLAEGGEILKRFGGAAPIDRGRLYRMTTDYPVPMEQTFAVLGQGPTSLDLGIERTVAWLRERHPGEFRR